MGVSISWANDDHTIVTYTFADPWTWDEFYRCWDWLKAEMDASDQPISIIMDLRAFRTIPPDIMKHLKGILVQMHPNFSRATAYVGAGMLKTMYPVVLRQLAPEMVGQVQAFFAPTLEEARQLLDDWGSQQKLKDSR